MDGLLTEVLVSTQGSAATAAVASGTTVPVENLTPFASDGGKVDIAGTVYDYTGVDESTVDADGVGGAIVLASPGLTAPVDEFDPVLLVVGDSPAVDYYAVVDLIDDEDGEPAWVPLETREERLAWPVRVYDPPLPVTLSADLSQILRAPGVTPQMDGSMIDASTLPPMPGGQTISDDAPVEVAGYPEDYGWWQVDADGKVLGFWRLTGGVWTPATVVTQDALNANNVLTNALTGKTITGTTIQTRAVADRGIKLGQVQGSTNYDEAFIVFNESGVPFIKAVPAEELAVIAGEVKATTSTVIEGASLGGVTEITRGPVNADNPTGSPGALRLTAYTTAPKSAPTVTTGYDSVQFTNDGLWEPRHGWATDGTYWYTTESSGVLEKWDTTGTLVATGNFNVGGLPVGTVHHGGYLYTLIDSDPGWAVVRSVAATLVPDYGHSIAYWIHADGLRRPAIGVDSATGDLLIAQSRPSDATIPGRVRIRRYTWPANEFDNLTAGTSVDCDFAYANDLSGVTYGTHDFGANRYVFTTRDSGRFQVVDSTGAAVDAERWQSGMAYKVGFTYTGGAFKSMDQNGLMRTYTGQDKAVVIGDAALTKWISNDLSTATLHTEQSPRAKIVQPKRTKLNVTTSAINTAGANAPDRVRIFVGTGAADPGRTAMWKQTDPGVGVTTTSYPSLATSGTNPVTPNGFIAAGGTVQRLELADGTVLVDGLGAGSAWTTYTPTFTALSTNPTLGNFTRSGRYARLGRNTIVFSIVITSTSTTGLGVGAYEFGLPVAARAADEVVVAGMQSGPTHVYGGRGETTTTFRLYLTSTEVAMTSANSGMASTTILRISGTYEAA